MIDYMDSRKQSIMDAYKSADFILIKTPIDSRLISGSTTSTEQMSTYSSGTKGSTKQCIASSVNLMENSRIRITSTEVKPF